MKERELFLAALEIEDPAARLAHLKTECGNDAALLARVESLLASHEGQSRFLNTPVAEQIAEITDAEIAATSVVGNGSTQDEELDATTLFTPGKSRMTEQHDESGDTMRIGYLETSTKPGSLGRLAHYEVLQVIGRGAFGVVLRAFDEKLQRVVAIKVMSPEMASTSPARKRFLREAQASAAIRHEHVVSVYAVEEKPIPYLVMEYIPGLTLQQRLDEGGPLDVPTVLRLGRQIAEGLEAAHSQDLIHRDIKPGNILLEAGVLDKVKITDFGLARAADDASLTQSGTIAGTPMYMAPEQALGHKLDRRADLFSLGSVLYQMVSGRPPFRAPTALAVLKRVVEETPRPIREIIPETPQWLCDIITKLHAKKPDDRYQSAREVADVLADCEVQLKANARLRDFSRIPRSKSASSAKWKLFTAGGVVGAMLFLGVIITLTTKDGAKTKIEVPDTSPVEVTTNRGESRETSDGLTTSDDRSLTASATKTGWHGWPANAPKPAIAPFDAAQARAHQEAWARHLGVPVEYSNSIGMKFRLIPPGEFTMGSTAEEIEAALKNVGQNINQWEEYIRSEAPQHKVILRQPIFLGVNEVTQSEYEKVMGVNPSHFAPTGMGKERVAEMTTTGHPVETVSWNDATEFCAKLSEREKLNPFYFRAGDDITRLDGTGYRLPSEAEWEFACRAGTTAKYWIGEADQDLLRAGWFGGDASGHRTHVAGELMANPFGLYDIHGNVWELVQDGWDATFYGQFQEKAAVSPNSPFLAGSQRVIRGGSWSVAAPFCRSQNRLPNVPALRFEDTGFRVSLTVDAVKAAIANRPPMTQGANTAWHGWPANAPNPAIAPFDVAHARNLQDAWARHLGVPVEYTNSIGMKFRLIPPGEFLMGSTPSEIKESLKAAYPTATHWHDCIRSEAPQHKVILTQPIYLGIHEVTQAEYQNVTGTNPSYFSPNGPGQPVVAGMETTHHPVERVSSHDAVEFCDKLSQREKLIPRPDVSGYRLPSEAEWEFACRAGTTTKFWIGDDDTALEQAGWFGENSRDRTHAVGELKANPFGLFDVHGNVWEWVQDGWEPGFYRDFANKPAINPISLYSSETAQIVRGGRWYHDATYCRSAFRLSVAPTDRFEDLGFRVALSVDAVKSAMAADHVRSSTKTEPSKRRFISDEWIDVIPLIDPDTDKWDVPQRTGKNAWRRVGTELLCGGDQRASKLILPLDSDWPAFECELEFTRLSGESGFNVNIPTKVGECPLLFDPTGTKGAFLGSRANGVQWKTEKQLETGKRTTIRFDVRRQQASDQVTADLNGVSLGKWTGDRNTISHSYREGFPHDRRISLWIHPGGNEFTFHRIRIRMLDGGTAETLRSVLKSALPAAAPYMEADIERVAALPAAEQVEEVRKELKKRNPEFDGTLIPMIENDVVTGIEFFSNHVSDISPLRAFPRLSSLNCRANGSLVGMVSDLKPLKGMSFVKLTLSVNPVSDLSPLKGMPL
ncbi:MAG: bifunctional serine/threonine-protein kinase/formylglycine-generating enzyme family protein, partial [Planctomycetota bacterium]